MNLRHREVIRLAFSGMKSNLIAEQVGLSVTVVRNILRSPLAQGEIARLSEKADESLTNVPLRVRLLHELNQVGESAVRINRELMEDGRIDPRVRAGVARHFMDRIVFGRVEEEREGSYRDILRSLDSIERKLDPATLTVIPGMVEGGNGNSAH